jgi:hypothetical protein
LPRFLGDLLVAAGLGVMDLAMIAAPDLTNMGWVKGERLWRYAVALETALHRRW